MEAKLEDGEAFAKLMKSMGIDTWTPRVISLLLEFTEGYVADVLDDSLAFARHAGRQEIDVSDLSLAYQSSDVFLSESLPIFTSELDQINTKPLPPISHEWGVNLPPVELQKTDPSIKVADRGDAMDVE